MTPRHRGNHSKLYLIALGAVFVPAAAHAQVPDLVNAFDAGGRAMGMGSSTNVTGSETLSTYYNPAGLGYLHKAQIGGTMRNLPKAESGVVGDVNGDHTLVTTKEFGKNSITHLGIAVPLPKNGGTIGVSFTTGGIDQDQRYGTAFTTEGATPAPNYYQKLFNRTDFLSFAYGKSNAAETFNWGVALLYTMNHQSNTITGLTNGNTDFSATSHGWGGLVGISFAPSKNTVVGVSYRTPITLSGNQSLLYNKIPARLSAGMAYRLDYGTNFLVLGAQANNYFSGSRGQYFDSPNQTTLGVGLEYNYALERGYIPLRIGYNYQFESSAVDFDSRNTFTYGFGYRPPNNNWGVDLNFANAPSGGTDFGLNLFYRLGK